MKDIEEKLGTILAELKTQQDVWELIPQDLLSFDEQMEQLHEWIHEVSEYEIAYELITSLLKSFPFELNGQNKVYLSEIEASLIISSSSSPTNGNK
jgi:hypothetical protein